MTVINSPRAIARLAQEERAGLPTGLARSKVVMIGRPFAVPYLWIPSHLLPAAPKRGAPSTPS